MRVRACVQMIALEQSINLICDAVCLDRWTTACLDAVRLSPFGGLGGGFNCRFRWFGFGNAPDTVSEMQHVSSYVHAE